MIILGRGIITILQEEATQFMLEDIIIQTVQRGTLTPQEDIIIRQGLIEDMKLTETILLETIDTVHIRDTTILHIEHDTHIELGITTQETIMDT